MVITCAIIFSLIQIAYSQVCSDVYPHLSCGLSYSTQTECESVGCCWDSESSNPACFAPKINGISFFTFLLITLILLCDQVIVTLKQKRLQPQSLEFFPYHLPQEFFRMIFKI
jgi:hypothetical protein